MEPCWQRSCWRVAVWGQCCLGALGRDGLSLLGGCLPGMEAGKRTWPSNPLNTTAGESCFPV